MFDAEWASELDAMAVCDALSTAHADLVAVETRLLVLAAQWIDVNGPCQEPDADPARVLAGTGRFVRVGAEGTPEIDEFACAEFATLQDMHPVAGANLLRKVANLRHRHPLLWRRVHDAQVRAWKALEVARLVGRSDLALSLEQARWVDAQTQEWIDTLPWGQFLDLVEARIIACDPEAAEARRRQAEAEQFVATGRGTEHGLKTLIARATCGDVTYLAAMCDRIAAILALHGDTSPVGVRRARALGILATPARALALLQDTEHATDHTDPDDGSGPESDEGSDEESDDADHPAPATHPCPTCAGAGTVTGDPTAFVKPPVVDPARLLPRATLYVHLTQHGLHTGRGVARIEGVGPVTIGQAQDFLRHTNVRLLPVLDLADQRPVDGYEFPATTREAVHLISPRDVFPFAASTGRGFDIDHPVPYLHPDHGGPPAQTNTANAAPLLRFHHRLKTHGRWAIRQPGPGTYLWRSPHGWHWLTDHTGTHPIPRHLGQILWDALNHTTTNAA